MRVVSYDPAKVQVLIGGNVLSGFAPGTMVEVTEDTPKFADEVGVDGEPLRWNTNSPMATMTVYLMQSSTGNEALSNLHNLDRATGAALFPVSVEDKNPTDGQVPSGMIAGTAWIQGQPALAWAGGAPTARRWVIRMLSPVFHVTGQAQTDNVSL